MPSSSSFCAMMSLSSTEKEMDSPCVPSRRVVSKVEIFISTPNQRNEGLAAPRSSIAAPKCSRPSAGGRLTIGRRTTSCPALFGLLLRGGRLRLLRHPRFLLLFQERHHFPQFTAYDFHGL